MDDPRKKKNDGIRTFFGIGTPALFPGARKNRASKYSMGTSPSIRPPGRDTLTQVSPDARQRAIFQSTRSEDESSSRFGILHTADEHDRNRWADRFRSRESAGGRPAAICHCHTDMWTRKAPREREHRLSLRRRDRRVRQRRHDALRFGPSSRQSASLFCPEDGARSGLPEGCRADRRGSRRHWEQSLHAHCPARWSRTVPQDPRGQQKSARTGDPRLQWTAGHARTLFEQASFAWSRRSGKEDLHRDQGNCEQRPEQTAG